MPRYQLREEWASFLTRNSLEMQKAPGSRPGLCVCVVAKPQRAALAYLVIKRLGDAGAGGDGEIAKVSQAFQPSGRWALSNSP